MDVDIDPNEGDDLVLYQLRDDRFFLAVFVGRACLGELRGAVSSLEDEGEVLFGTIGCGERVWIVREEAGYWISVGDTDSKDVGIRLTRAELDLLLGAEVS